MIFRLLLINQIFFLPCKALSTGKYRSYTNTFIIAGSRRARNLVYTPYLDFGGNFVLQKSIDKSS